MCGSRRSVTELASGGAIRHLKYIPRIIMRVRNWPRFLLTYMRLSDKPAVYRLRDRDINIITRSGVDVSTIAVVFIKEDYGSTPSDGSTPSGQVVVDVGANIGAFSLFAAVSADVQVFAYEPVHETYDQLCENVRINGLEDRIKTFNLAVAGARERRAISLSPHGSPFSTLYGGAHESVERVQCVGLQDVFEENGIERCDVLKLDCEGAEFEILYGAPADTLERVQRICVEYHEYAERPRFRGRTLVDFLQERGFCLTSAFDKSRPFGTIWLEQPPRSAARL